jgi:lipid-binding SYLF domain-containing protein
MKTIMYLFLVSILSVSIGTLIAAPTDGNSNEKERAIKTLEKAVGALDNVMEDPHNNIPQSLINKSEGIVIFPGAFKIAVGCVGGQGARGIAMIRKEDGSWSNPFFVTLGKGSLGLQIGAQSSDIVLLFKNRNDIMEIDKAEITLGSDISAVAGPVNRGSSSSTDLDFEAAIYSYSRSRGLFAGVSLSGGILSYNEKVNDAFYGSYYVGTNEIFNEMVTPFNDQTEDLIASLNGYSQ